MKNWQLSSGRGPAECELAVGLYLKYLAAEYPALKVLSCQGEHEVTAGGLRFTAYQSVTLSLPPDIRLPEGSLKWKSKSPFRPNHGRQNWFFQISSVQDAVNLPFENKMKKADIKSRDLRFETFRSPGKGGQNVNKVETGVRVEHLPSGLIAASITARTQQGNKSLAVERLVEKMNAKNMARACQIKKVQRHLHDELIRGNQVQTFEGLDFKPVNSDRDTGDDQIKCKQT
ncbi:MAG: peptide chain release factor-like protein [Deltaproteobacteria bacterium]|nr:peptide chain release factor-like protein [Deltaproteobacteria bacterium]